MNRFKFPPLLIFGENYLRWTISCELKLNSKYLYETLDKESGMTEQQKNKAMVLIRKHLCEDLQNQYLTVMDPADLWQELKSRYNRRTEIILPKARDE